MMNYDCVSINLKSQDKAIFSSKKEACEYFNSHFGDDILADLKEQEKKLSKSCERCRKKENNKKECAVCERRKESEKVQKSINDVEQGKCCYYEWYFGDYKKKLLKETQFDLLRICGIYKVNSKYEVIEKIYKIITVVIEDVSNSDTLSSKIPEMMRVGQEAVIAIPKENDPKSIRKFISKMRLQVLNDHRKKCEKLIA